MSLPIVCGATHPETLAPCMLRPRHDGDGRGPIDITTVVGAHRSPLSGT